MIGRDNDTTELIGQKWVVSDDLFLGCGDGVVFE